jgi:hypothetical protein
MRGWVCHLQLLPVFASTVILRSEPNGTHDHILLPQIQGIQDSHNRQGPYPPPPRKEWPGYAPRHRVPFSLCPKTRRASVEIFDPAFTQVPSHLVNCGYAYM